MMNDQTDDFRWGGHTLRWPLAVILATWVVATHAAVVFETTSPYHHIRVVDQDGVRTLMFDSATESRLSLLNPLQDHFEYTEYFHAPWLWNPDIKNVLMIGLGGGTTALAWQHYYSNVVFEAVELDPKVVQVAKAYFHIKESPTLKIFTQDGRLFLRRSQQKYDLIILDAYTTSRYGSSIPYSLVTKEFFELAKDHLTTNGVLAYNLIGTAASHQINLVSSMYKTLKAVFPQVYYFPASSSRNVVLLATQSPTPYTPALLNQKWLELARRGWRTVPALQYRLRNFRADPPPAAARSRILVDDFAPTDGLIRAE